MKAKSITLFLRSKHHEIFRRPSDIDCYFDNSLLAFIRRSIVINLIEASTFDLCGETVNRLVLDIDDHEIQVIQYDENPNVLVCVDASMEIISIDNVVQYVIGRLDI